MLRVAATDADVGANGRVSYRIGHSADTHSDWFDIEPDTGLVVTRARVDCETDPEPRLVVIASDGGRPGRSSSATVRIAVQDVNDNEPIFEQAFYNATTQRVTLIKTWLPQKKHSSGWWDGGLGIIEKDPQIVGTRGH